MKTRIALFAAAAALTIGAAPAMAQFGPPASTKLEDQSNMPKELFVLPPVSKAYTPKKTAWGDPDLRGMWPIDAIGGLNLQRPASMGDRVWLTDQEYKAVSDRMEKQRGAAAAETKANRLGMGNWVEMTGAGRRNSMVVSPKNGRLPDLTEYGKRMRDVGRSSWVTPQTYDWVTDFDSWDRCVTRGFPASMLPFRYNNGVQIMQAPGYVVINLEMIHDARIIPIGNSPAPPKSVTSWMGESRGHWEGNTLVVETTNIRQGAAPFNAATLGGPQPAYNTIPMGPDAKVVERFTLVNKDTMTYEMTLTDPKVWTAPIELRMDWPRNEKYEFFEYACHEGDEQVRNYIIADRAKRAKIASGEMTEDEANGRRRRAPAAGAAPAPGGAPPAAGAPAAAPARPQAENAQPRAE
jgi:hypothetical protein